MPVEAVERGARLLASRGCPSPTTTASSSASSRIARIARIAASSRAADGGTPVRLEHKGKDITGDIDLGSVNTSKGVTRGPSEKAFDVSLGVRGADLEKMLREALERELGTRGTGGTK